ncbi:unnamed protein product [Brassica rapa subsp. narinosa]
MQTASHQRQREGYAFLLFVLSLIFFCIFLLPVNSPVMC